MAKRGATLLPEHCAKCLMMQTPRNSSSLSVNNVESLPICSCRSSHLLGKYLLVLLCVRNHSKYWDTWGNKTSEISTLFISLLWFDLETWDRMLLPLFLCVKCLIVTVTIILVGWSVSLMAGPNGKLILHIRREHRVKGPVCRPYLPGTL